MVAEVEELASVLSLRGGGSPGGKGARRMLAAHFAWARNHGCAFAFAGKDSGKGKGKGKDSFGKGKGKGDASTMHTIQHHACPGMHTSTCAYY